MGCVVNESSLQGGSVLFPGGRLGPFWALRALFRALWWFWLVSPCFLCILVELTAFGELSGQGFEAQKFNQNPHVFDQNEPKATNFNQNHVLVDFGAFWLVLVVVFRRQFVLNGSPADWTCLRLNLFDFL